MTQLDYGKKQPMAELVEVDVRPKGLVSPAHEDHHLSYGNPVATADDRTHDGSVDLKGHPVSKSSSGGFKAASFIIGVELGERLAYYGILSNLYVYLTSVLRESLPVAVKNVTNWSGVTLVMPIVGGFVADAYVGKYWTIAVVSGIYVLGLLLLTLSASVPSLKPSSCKVTTAGVCPKASKGQVAFFFMSLYLISVGTGGIKPCLEAFGADQFDDEDMTERKQKSSFFNWWYFALCIGGLLAVTVLVWLDDNVSWALGFGIPTIVMMIACIVFYVGTRHYRHKLPGGSPLTQIAQVLVACIRNRHAKLPSHPSSLHEIYTDPSMPASRRQLLHTDKFKCFDKAAVDITSNVGGNQHGISLSGRPSAWKLCTVTQVEEVKLVVKLLPVWLTTFAYGVVFAQTATFFVSQAATMDRAMGNFQIPQSTFQVFMTFTVLLLLPLYDRVFVSMARKLTGNERGITMLQRIGIGLFFSFLSMVAAALVEARRLRVASRNGLLDSPKVTLPMSAFWIIPQYVLIGIADVFTLVGEQEFFYDQVPDSMRSLGMALYLSANGMGSFISNLLLTIVSATTGKEPWFLASNLNRSRVDLFYWLLAVLSILNLMAFIVVAFFYEYKRVKSPLAGGLHNGMAPAHTGLSHKDSLQRYHHRPSNASSTSSQ
ncbi:hypothetical protein GOP47_0022860 [Adiantum capillus-veneris]|uniref:Uncharacterized protein n=1 Tax=Adiantum capillus-veneris TaxID=13818 RepID=A0A9D4Z797_ADICA|nr:hypothetical protein GOP47_0022860 [Adiantum capillus-veneris]